MTNKERQILRYIRDCRGVTWGDVLNAFDPEREINRTHRELKDLLAMGYIDALAASPRSKVRLTCKGLEECDQNKRRCQNRIMNMLTGLAVFFARLAVKIGRRR